MACLQIVAFNRSIFSPGSFEFDLFSAAATRPGTAAIKASSAPYSAVARIGRILTRSTPEPLGHLLDRPRLQGMYLTFGATLLWLGVAPACSP